MTSSARLLRLLVLAILSVGLLSAAASARTPKRKSKALPAVLLHSRFHQVAANIGGVKTDGHYVFLQDSAPPPINSGGTLLDEQTGKRTRVSPSLVCYPRLIGGPWLLFQCSRFPSDPTFIELYQLATGQRKTITNPPGVAVAVGAAWIEFQMGCDGEHCGSPTTVFQSISTGQAVSVLNGWTPGGTTFPDLNSPELAGKLCAPLRIPRGFWSPFGSSPPPDSLTFYGNFAVTVDWTGAPGENQDFRTHIQRCGSRLRETIGNDAVGNVHAVVWASLASAKYDGLFLPSLRRFSIVIPSAVNNVTQMALSSKTLYVLKQNGELLATASPTPPQPHGRR